MRRIPVWARWLVLLLLLATLIGLTHALRGDPEKAALRAELERDPAAFRQSIVDMDHRLDRLEHRHGVGVTFANYQRLKDGMSYQQAVAVLENEGRESARSSIGDVTTVMYLWEGAWSDSANMNATFQNDRLVSKAQFGLR